MLSGGLRHLRRPGPDRGPDSAGRSRAHQHDAVERRALAYPLDRGGDPRQLHRPTRTTARISRAPTPTTTRCPKRSTSTPRRCSRSCGAAWPRSVAYVGSQGRNLFLRSIANRTIGVHFERRRRRRRKSVSSTSSRARRRSTARIRAQHGLASSRRTPRSTTRPAAATTATTRMQLSLTRRVAATAWP